VPSVQELGRSVPIPALVDEVNSSELTIAGNPSELFLLEEPGCTAVNHCGSGSPGTRLLKAGNVSNPVDCDVSNKTSQIRNPLSREIGKLGI
jgi:hypothetical protein